MKVRFTLPSALWLYFFLLLLIYHLEVKHYFYWEYIAQLMNKEFDFSTSRLLISIGLFYLNVFFYNRQNKESLIYTVGGIVFLLLTIPSLTAYTSEGMYPSVLLFYHQFLFYAIIGVGRLKIDLDKIPTLNKKQSLILLILITCVGIVPYLIFYGPHINLKNLILIDIYKTREQMSGISNPYFSYTYSIFTKIIVPLILVFALELKNKLLLVIGIGFLLLFFLFGAHKTVYLGIFLILLFYRFSYRYIISKLVLTLNLLLAICLVLALFSYDYLWILTIRRVQFIPTLLDISYYDFFREPIYWSESILKSFFNYPFDLPHTALIGREYFARTSFGANNGLIADGYMNAHSLGVFVNIVLFSAYFMFLNNLKLPSKYFGLFFLVVYSFISSSLLTVFITHGALVLLLTSIFILHEKEG